MKIKNYTFLFEVQKNVYFRAHLILDFILKIYQNKIQLLKISKLKKNYNLQFLLKNV